MLGLVQPNGCRGCTGGVTVADDGDVLTFQDPQVDGKSQAFKPPATFGELLDNDNDANTNNITNLSDPNDDQDAATKAYVDGLAAPQSLESVLETGNSVNGEDGGDDEGHSLVAKNAGIASARIALAKAGMATISIPDEFGTVLAQFSVEASTLSMSVDEGAVSVVFTAGMITLGTAAALVSIQPTGEIAFTGTSFHYTGTGVPELPAIPIAQDIADALVALGLVTQAAP
jgi:hypothetical protein